MKNKMFRANLFIRNDQYQTILKEAEEKGITISEVMRMALDLYIKENIKEKNNG